MSTADDSVNLNKDDGSRAGPSTAPTPMEIDRVDVSRKMFEKKKSAVTYMILF